MPSGSREFVPERLEGRANARGRHGSLGGFGGEREDAGARGSDAAGWMACHRGPYTHRNVLCVGVGVLRPTGIHVAYFVVRRVQWGLFLCCPYVGSSTVFGRGRS